MLNLEEIRRQEVLLRRLVAMGLEAHPMPGGRSLVAILPLSTAPFESLWGDQHFDTVRLATVGVDRAKCLTPRALFHLPLIRIVDCDDIASLEARVRSVWSDHVQRLERAAVWLEKLGGRVVRDPAEPFLPLPVGAQGGAGTAAVVEPRRIIVPGLGALSGVTLHRAEDRTFQPDPGCESLTDLELMVSARLEELARLDARFAREQASRRAADLPPPSPESAGHHLLFVGPRLVDNTALIESLRLRDYRVATARSANEALRIFDISSPELVFTDSRLDRFDGIELIPALRALEGMEEVPVVLVDERQRSERRDATRRMGGAGYLVHPIDFPKLAKGIAKLVSKPRRRRFTRYPHRLSVSWSGRQHGGVTTNLGRGGMLLCADHHTEMRTVDHYEISVPTLGETIRVDAKIAYRIRAVGEDRLGVGLRFVAFPDDSESLLINVLGSLSPTELAS